MSKINRREFGKKLFIGTAGLTTLASGLSSIEGAPKIKMGAIGNHTDSKRPNFVFISSDQHSFRYSGFMGDPLVKTPNLDKIASKGVVLENNYCGSPVCVAGRACMMTGMYPSDVNSFGNTTVYDGSYPTWGKRLRDSGYYCWGTGKADLNNVSDLGFEGMLSNGHAKGPDITELFRRPTIFRLDERDDVNGDTRTEPSRDNKIAEDAIDFIKNKTKSLGKPWAVYIGFYSPHPKWVGLKKYFDYYLPLVTPPYYPDTYLEELPLPYQVLRHFKRISTPIPMERMIRARAAYFSMITELDEYIGKVYASVEATGQIDNTYFVYTTDHGEALGYNGLWLKNNLYEGAAHIPLVFSGPGLTPGLRIKEPTGHIDFIATMMEWAGLGHIKELRGTSLTPLLNGKQTGEVRFAYTESHSEGNPAGSCMIRVGDWKLMHFTWYSDYLFNLKEDPNEYHNLNNNPDYKDKSKELKNILNNLVNTEEITLRAFKCQNKYLTKYNDTMSEKELIHFLKRRLGEGQATYITRKIKSGMLS